MRVLVPRDGQWGAEAAAALRAAGLEPLVVPLLRIEPSRSPALDTALERLATGAVDWLVVTSAAVAPLLPSVAGDVRVAAVGEGTARALRARGIRVDLVPERQSAAGIVAEWPEHGGTALWPRAAAARPTIAEGLRARGVSVTDVVAYRSVPAFPDAAALARAIGLDGSRGDTASGDRGVAAAAPDAVLVTSGSVAEQLTRVPLAPRTRVVAIGPQTAADCRDAGLTADAIAESPSIEGLVAALRGLRA